MDGYILVIDDEGELSNGVRELCLSSSAKVVVVPDGTKAKAKLLQSTAAVIMCSATIDGDVDAGTRLCSQLAGHELFAKIPVLLFSESFATEVPEEAQACGAKACLHWPLTKEELAKGLEAIIPDVVASFGISAEIQEVVIEEAPEEAPPPVAAKPVAQSAEVDSEEKFKRAQHLLAKVLHNLKTSNVLEFAEADEVPRIVAEMTRSVCGITDEE